MKECGTLCQTYKDINMLYKYTVRKPKAMSYDKIPAADEAEAAWSPVSHIFCFSFSGRMIERLWEHVRPVWSLLMIAACEVVEQAVLDSGQKKAYLGMVFV